MDWARAGDDWPHRERSRFVSSGARRWFVQQWPAPSPSAPRLLLLHGTGASSHSWRSLAPLLAQQAGVVAVDLPGHGFSDPARGDGATLPGMARGVAALLREMGVAPSVLIGHSAGAAIAARMALDRPQDFESIISLNGALLPLHGLAGQVFSPLAKLLAANRLVPHLFSWSANDPKRVRRLVAGTGSTPRRCRRRALWPAGQRPGACGRRVGDDGELGPARACGRLADAANAAATCWRQRTTSRCRPSIHSAWRPCCRRPASSACQDWGIWRTRKTRSRCCGT